jgi:hypothetical protein
MASQRVPVEVWEHVLYYAIACPLLPSEDDNLVNSLRFFSHYCEDTVDFMHTERTRITLQLVCKTWNAILKSQSQRFWVGPRSKLPFVSSFYRVDLHHLSPRVCQCPQRIPPLELVTKRGPQLLEAVVACDWEIGLEHIKNIENLRVLSLYASDRGSSFPVGLSSFAKYSRSLTHLQLWISSSQNALINLSSSCAYIPFPSSTVVGHPGLLGIHHQQMSIITRDSAFGFCHP